MARIETFVVNLYKEKYDVYVGRPGKGGDGYFGNPFATGSREDSIKLFRKYFYDRIKWDEEFRKRVHELKGKILGCFCKPRNCHADVIAEYLNNLPDVLPVVTGIIVSKGFSDYDYVKEVLAWHEMKRIVNAGDGIIQRYGAEKNIPITIVTTDWNRHGKGAAFKRDAKTIQSSEEIVIFWDGVTREMIQVIEMAQDSGKSVYIYRPKIVDDIALLG